MIFNESTFEHAEILPDSRAKVTRASEFRGDGWWVPIFCGNCGCDGGRVPESNMTFVFWMCHPCFEKYGELTTMMVMPDEIFWETVKQEQLEQYGRFLTQEELETVMQEDSSPLAKLIKNRR